MKTQRPGLALAVVVGLAMGVVAWGDSAGDAKSAESTPMQLPEGWTMQDVEACMAASTPGQMHQRLVKDVGIWHCQTTMWMGPAGEPVKGEGTVTITSIMDGRYTQCEIEGEMPGMGPYRALGFYGFDNVTQRFVSSFMDNHSTGMSQGVGRLSSDGKVLSWEYTMSCPITKQPTMVREVFTMTGEDTRLWEMFGKDPKSGKDYQMMRVEMGRK